MILTAKTLVQKDACPVAVERFRALFGKEVEVTEALAVEHAQVFDWDWAAEKLLSPAGRAKYERVTTSAWAKYERVMTSAWAKYERARASAWAEYERVRAPALAEYDRVMAMTWARLMLEKDGA